MFFFIYFSTYGIFIYAGMLNSARQMFLINVGPVGKFVDKFFFLGGLLCFLLFFFFTNFWQILGPNLAKNAGIQFLNLPFLDTLF